MADKEKSNEEYQYEDIDALNPDAFSEDSYEVSDEAAHPLAGGKLSGTNVKRNVLITIGIVIFLMVLYKFFEAFYFSQPVIEEKTKPAPPQPRMTAQPKPVPKPIQRPIQASRPKSVEVSKVEKKLAALDISQQSIRSEVTTVGNQLGGLNANMNELSSQIILLRQAVSSLNSKLDSHSRELDVLLARTKPKKDIYAKRKRKDAVKYFVQAVIPGRAWLISSNGDTLTIREGTSVPGYGTVKLIDPHQGRVTTSSGQVIQFSKSDI